MRAAGLEAIDVVMKTQAVLIGNSHPSNTRLVERIRKRIEGILILSYSFASLLGLGSAST